jgi:arylsulfatase A
MTIRTKITARFVLVCKLILVCSLLSLQAQGRPNIVFIMADDVGYNDLAAYGQILFPTPHTDRLADQGARLTAAYSPSAVCSPTRYAVLTGTDPFRQLITSHVLFNAEPMMIRPGESTVASLLQDVGYATGVIGKWHLGLGDSLPRDLNNPGRGPNEIGFDYSFLVPDGHNMLPHYYHENGLVVGGTEPAFESSLAIETRVGLQLLKHNPVGTWEYRRPYNQIGATLADKVDAFIEKHADQPFFLYYATCSVHSPLTPDPQFVGKSGIGPFGDFVMEFDWAVGRVMAKLEELGLTDNTLLIVTSDNGGLSNREINLPEEVHRTAHPWRSEKGSMYEGGVRVPLLARWPGHIPAGSVSDVSLSLVDLKATVARLAGLDLPENGALDSFDMLPALRGEASPRQSLITGTRGIDSVAIRQGHWKLITYASGATPELYHLIDDPQETNNFVEQKPEIVDHLQLELDSYFEHGHSRPGAVAVGKPMREILAERQVRNALTQSILMDNSDLALILPISEENLGAFEAGSARVEPLNQGVTLFTDRSNRMLEVPEPLVGSHFIQLPLEGSKSVRVSRSGFVWVLTPATGVNPDSQQKLLEQQGFRMVDLTSFPAWNPNPRNHVNVFEKKVAQGDVITFGQWAVPVFRP